MQHGGLIVQFWMIVRDNDDFYSVQTFKPIPMPPRKSMVNIVFYWLTEDIQPQGDFYEKEKAQNQKQATSP